MNRRAMTKPVFTLAIAALSLSLAACSGPGKVEEPVVGAMIDGSTIGGPFTLTDKDGKRVSWDDFKGTYRVVYFGYTFCPDACPMDMSVLIQGFAKFAAAHPQEAAKVQPIFITIDPARDTPARVGEFTAAFSPKLIGLTGTQAEVDVAVKAFKVVAARGTDTLGGYLMDHSRMAYLMDPDGKPIAALPVDVNADSVAGDLAKLVK